MKRFYIQERDFIPGVILDKEKNKFEITGKACPENMEEFYDPIFKWLDEYIENPNEITEFHINLQYYNTASSKAILKIMQKLEKLHNKNKNVKIIWHYEEDDEELLIAGEDYAELISVPFEFVKN